MVLSNIPTTSAGNSLQHGDKIYAGSATWKKGSVQDGADETGCSQRSLPISDLPYSTCVFSKACEQSDCSNWTPLHMALHFFHLAQEQSGISHSTYTFWKAGSCTKVQAAVAVCPGAQKFELQIPIVPSTCTIGYTLNLLLLSVYGCLLREHSNVMGIPLSTPSSIIHHWEGYQVT